MDYTAYVFPIGPNVGLTALDLWLLALCPIAAALGIGVSTVLNKQGTPSQPPRSLSYWLGRIFVGCMLGLLIALYFVGAITESLTSVARILALCILLGYQAPNIWHSQERVIASIIEKKLKAALKDVDSAASKASNKDSDFGKS